MEITTTGCARHGHPEFRLSVDSAVVPDTYLTATADTVERMVADGSMFRPGQTFQIGWMITRVEADGPGHLTLYEPDLVSFPIQFVPGITQTLRTQMLQLFVADSVGLRHEMAVPSILQSALVCTWYADRDFFAERFTPSAPTDCGWFFGCRRPDHDHSDPGQLQRTSLYDAFLHQPGIQGLVGLPVGLMVLNEGAGPIFLRGGAPLTVQPGSFVDRMFP